MSYTLALEEPDTKWSLSDFISSHGYFSIIREAETGRWTGRFNNRGKWTHVHIEKKVRGTPISYILSHQDEYEVFVAYDTYCLNKVGAIPDYSTIWEDLHPDDAGELKGLNAQEYYEENSDQVGFGI